MSDYFSDRQNGPRARTEQEISPTVWAGLVATVQTLTLINSGAFGLRFPERCPDGQATCGGDADALAASVSAEMPGLAWPLETVSIDGEGYLAERQPFAPDTLLVLDFIEFVLRLRHPARREGGQPGCRRGRGLDCDFRAQGSHLVAAGDPADGAAVGVRGYLSDHPAGVAQDPAQRWCAKAN